MDTQTLIESLTQDYGYPPDGAALVADKITRLTAPVDQAFSAWWQTGQPPTIELQGYTVERLMNEHTMNAIAAFLTLDWLNREPDKALAALKKGHDWIK